MALSPARFEDKTRVAPAKAEKESIFAAFGRWTGVEEAEAGRSGKKEQPMIWRTL
jgi:hypothetical protein